MGDDRRARLQALAARAGRHKEVAASEDDAYTMPSTSPPREGANSFKRAISFRNYAPQDKGLEQPENDDAEVSTATTATQRPPSKRQRAAEPSTSLAEESTLSSDALQHALAKARQEMMNDGAVAPPGNHGVRAAVAAQKATTTPVTRMAPKKINWDLKRDIADKLAKLERRTQKAMVEMLKERLEVQAAEAANDDDGGNLD
jgi:coiled-coil domain-containing protein 12